VKYRVVLHLTVEGQDMLDALMPVGEALHFAEDVLVLEFDRVQP
jgi:hypothetical protein